MYSLKDTQAALGALSKSPEQVRATRLNVFKPYYQRFLESPKFKNREASIADVDYFGSVLHRQAILPTVCNESVSFSNQIGGAQTVVGLDYVTSYEVENILPMIGCSQVGTEETMQDKFGVFRYEKITAGTAKGNVQVGDVLLGAGTAPEVYAEGLASEMKLGEVLAAAASDDESLTYTGTTDVKPIRPHYIKITTPDGATLTDDGAGHIIGDAGYGTVNYTTGAISITLASAVTTAGNIVIDYCDNMELGGVAKINIEFDAKMVKSTVYGLQSDTSILSNYLMKKIYNYDVQQRAIALVQRMILNEQVTELVKKLEAVCKKPTMDLTQFDAAKPTYYSVQANNETLDLAFGQVAQKMALKSDFGELSVALCGPDATTIVKSLSKFQLTGKIAATATFLGIYDNKTLVFNVPQMAAKAGIIFLGKDDASALLAAVCNLVTMPLVTVKDLPSSMNITQTINGCFTLAAVDVLNERLIQNFKIVNTPYPVVAQS